MKQDSEMDMTLEDLAERHYELGKEIAGLNDEKRHTEAAIMEKLGYPPAPSKDRAGRMLVQQNKPGVTKKFNAEKFEYVGMERFGADVMRAVLDLYDQCIEEKPRKGAFSVKLAG